PSCSPTRSQVSSPPATRSTEPMVTEARANPLCGPSDTTYRFALLAATTVAASAFAWDWLWMTFNGGKFQSTLVACEDKLTANGTFDNSIDGSAAHSRALQRCLGSISRDQALWSILGAVAVVLGALVITAGLPRWKVWRRRLTPIAERLPRIDDRVG